MKFLLVAVNASYSHTNLAIRSICEYVKQNSSSNAEIKFAEFTINQPVGEILRGIAAENPDIVMFSTYIWNGEIISKIIPDIKKLIPNCKIGAGGPEFGYGADKYFKTLKDLDFIIKGEGEQIVNYLVNNQDFILDETKTEEICIHQEVLPSFNTRSRTKYFQLLPDLGTLPFPYPELKKGDFSQIDNKIFYYESSRGCPFNCAYCMSSLDRKVRFMPLDQVFADLQIFLDANVRLVKFVDRTYNLNPERYIKIWEYILNHHNGKTMFHFEIEAEFLSEEALEFLQKVPEGVMQFEIGVQSSNKETLKSINRSENVEKLAQNVKRIPRTIHQHLDLIAGLPYEDFESFGNSFDFVMSLKPDALQLGFLKVLAGTEMEEYAKNNGWKWMENPAYETFSTPYLSYSDILKLKDIEVLVDAYYNSKTFSTVMSYIERTTGFWKFFTELLEIARSLKVFEVQHKEQFWFEFLALHYKTEDKVLYDLIRYDFIRRSKQGNFPIWYKHNYNKDAHRHLLEQNGGVTNARLDFAYSEYETFCCNPQAELPEQTLGTETEILFKYKKKGV